MLATMSRRDASRPLTIPQADSLFFSQCCSNQRAVHVDSDVHRSDIATHTLLGGQHGEESEEGEEGEEVQGEEVILFSERRGRQ